MVLIDGIKYACQSCIKGHRSSKCTHTTRPLQEIKKKGRPTSQCAHCREQRKTKSVHARCDCAARGKEEKATPRVLPNGLSDAMLLVSLAEGDGSDASGSGASGSGLVRTDASGVTRLLNPCTCLRGGKCTCCSQAAPAAAKKSFPGEEEGAPVASTSGGCRSSASSTAPFADELPVPPPLPAAASTSSCCGPPPPASSTSLDIPVFSPPLPPPPPRSTEPLFSPRTHGTSSCFCGPTCSCVGCAVHDPQSRKRPAPGGCSGGGCHCGDSEDESCTGKRPKTRVRVEEDAKEDGGGCCGKGKARDTGECGSRPDSGISLPALWSLSEEDVSSATGEITARPLPSLRTLWPALPGALAPSLPGAFPLPSSADRDAPSVAPAAAQGAGDESTFFAAPEQAGCGAMYADDPLAAPCADLVPSSATVDGDADLALGCACSSDCGCRRGLDGGAEVEGSEADAEGETDDEWVAVDKGEEEREKKLEELARQAALGVFG
ncbi:hypothetical protein JCM10213_008308 [Rhodosporidiobolus nylandii]